jgi:hypothetical protein
MLREASWPWEDEDVDGRNIYAKFGAVGDRKITVGVYGKDCAVVCWSSMDEATVKSSDMRRIVPNDNCRKFKRKVASRYRPQAASSC